MTMTDFYYSSYDTKVITFQTTSKSIIDQNNVDLLYVTNNDSQEDIMEIYDEEIDKIHIVNNLYIQYIGNNLIPIKIYDVVLKKDDIESINYIDSHGIFRKHKIGVNSFIPNFGEFVKFNSASTTDSKNIIMREGIVLYKTLEQPLYLSLLNVFDKSIHCDYTGPCKLWNKSTGELLQNMLVENGTLLHVNNSVNSKEK